MPLTPVEVCIDQPEHLQFLSAETCQRIEMCSHLEEDGLTPSIVSIREACQAGFEVVAMVRPRSGDFCYTREELDQMKRDVPELLAAGASGIVLGLLNSKGRVPEKELRELVQSCEGHPVTFHRAFDQCRQRAEDLEILIESGCQRVLTSGGAASAWEGREELRRLVIQADSRIDIIAGGGVRPGHAADLITTTDVPWIHLSARRNAQTPDPDLLRELQTELASIDR
jgi:copper homeostasis protein